MTPTEAVALVSLWPKDRSVPRRLKAAHDRARGLDRVEIGLLQEALVAASETEQDLRLVAEYWD